MKTLIYKTKVGPFNVELHKAHKFMVKTPYYIHVRRNDAVSFCDYGYLWYDGKMRQFASEFGEFGGWFSSIKAARAAIAKFRKLSKMSV